VVKALACALCAFACLAILAGSQLPGTLSIFQAAQSRGQSVSTPPLLNVSPSTPASADSDSLSISGLSPGSSTDELLNLLNGGSSIATIAATVTTSSSTLLDTDATNGLQVEIDRCSTQWQQTVTGASAVCNASSSVIFTSTPLASANGASPTLISSGLSALSSGGVDHLRIRFSLPASAPSGYSGLTSTPTVSISAQLAPSAPLGVTLTPGDGQIAVNWNPPSSAGDSAIIGYTVSASPSGSTCTTTSVTSCTLTGLTDGATQQVTVAATNSFGAGSASAPLTATPYPATLFTNASGLSLWLNAADSSTVFSSSGCSGAVGAGTSVGCWQDTSGVGENFTQAISGNQPALGSLNGLGAIDFTSAAQVLNSINGTDAYQTVFIATQPQSTPSGWDQVFGQAGGDFTIRTTNGGGQFSFPNSNDWAGNTGSPPLDWSNGRQGVDPTIGATSILTAQASGPQTFSASVSDTFYGRGMIGDVGEVIAFSGTLTTAQRRTVEDYLAHKWGVSITPDPPGTPTATAGTASASVSWTAPAYNGGSPVTGYTVTASPGAQTCTTSGATSCSISGLTPQTTYAFTVTATNSIGTSASTSASNSVTPGTDPSAPLAVALTAGDGQIGVNWSVPASAGSSSIVGYTALASPSGATCATTSATMCTITGLTDGATQTVTVTANNASGSGASSAAASATPYPASLFTQANGLSLWLDAANTGTLYSSSSCTGAASAGGFVGCWQDASGVGEDFTQATAGSQPVLASLNGLGAIDFTSAAQVLNSINGSDTYQTVFIATEPETTSTGYDYIFGQAGADFNVRLSSSGNQFASPDSQDWTWSTGTPPLAWSNGRQAVNPTLGSTSILTDQTSSPQTFSTSISNTFHSRGLIGDVGEVIAFSGTLSTNQRRTVEDYLARKWGVTITPHPPGTPTPTAGTASAPVSWTAPAYTGGSPVTGYTVTSSPGAKTCTTTGATSCTVSGLTSGTAYTFTATATNAIGTSASTPASNQIAAQ
jgi:hypothetical protein